MLECLLPAALLLAILTQPLYAFRPLLPQSGRFGGLAPLRAAAASLPVPPEVTSQLGERGIDCYLCSGDEGCEPLGFNELAGPCYYCYATTTTTRTLLLTCHLLPAVAKLWRDVNDFSEGLETPEMKWDRTTAAISMVQENKERVVAMDDGEVVATVLFGDTSGHVAAVMTEPGHRRQRIATMLMAAAWGRMRDRGVAKSMNLEVQDRSPHLIQIYERMGFVVKERKAAEEQSVMVLDMAADTLLAQLNEADES